MRIIGRAFLVALVTGGGALIAWPLLVHRHWAWILVVAVGVIALLGFAGYAWAATRLGRKPLTYLTWLEWTTAIIPVSLGLLAATFIAWLTGRYGPGDGRLHADLGVGLGGITAAVAAGFVDPLKDGGLRASRIRAVFRKAYLPRVTGLPERWELSLRSDNHAPNWATAAARKQRAQEFKNLPTPGTSATAQLFIAEGKILQPSEAGQDTVSATWLRPMSEAGFLQAGYSDPAGQRVVMVLCAPNPAEIKQRLDHLPDVRDQKVSFAVVPVSRLGVR